MRSILVAMFIKSRAEDRVVSRAVLVVSGIRDIGLPRDFRRAHGRHEEPCYVG